MSLFIKPCDTDNKSLLINEAGKLRRGSLKKNKKPEWVVQKEKISHKKIVQKIWLYGIHAVGDALRNPKRIKYKLIVTPNACKKLDAEITKSTIRVEIIEPKQFLPPIEKTAVHQGAALEASPLKWGSLSEVCAPKEESKLVLLLDRVTDPQNVGAILRSAEVFGATAVASPLRYSSPETGALAKAASGALERQPYLRLPNLARAIFSLKKMGYFCIGLSGTSKFDLNDCLKQIPKGPVALIVGAEGPGLRELTLKSCDQIARIPSHRDFGSLNVSNAAALSLYITRSQINKW